MKNTYSFKILTPLVLVVAVLLSWRYWPAKSTDKRTPDTPEMILDHVRASKSPLTLINFWASWCEPCKVELPALKSLKEEYASKGLNVILVSIDDHDDIPLAADFLKENDLNFTTFYKGDQPLKFVSQLYPEWTGAVPATIILGPDLKILDAWEGDASLTEFQDRVKKLFEAKPHES